MREMPFSTVSSWPPLLLLLWASITSSTTICPSGEFSIVGTKHLYWDTTEVAWDDARAGCPPNSTLAVVESAAEMAAMKSKCEDEGNKRYYTALHNNAHLTCSNSGCTGVLQWAGHGAPFVYESWFNGAQAGNAAAGGDGCIKFNRDKIEVSPCDEERPFVCQCDQAAEPPTDCPADPMWVRHGSKYYGISDYGMTFSDAGAYCVAHGGKLASIHTEEGFNAVATAIVAYGKTGYIDLENPTFAECTSQSACHGVAKNAAGDALNTNTYVAGSALTFDFTGATASRTCLDLSGFTKIEDISCGSKRRAICESTCDYPGPPTVCPVISPVVNMFMIGGRLYHQSLDELEWQDAKRYCNNLNLELASIRTPDEYDNVKSHLVGASSGQYIDVHNPDHISCSSASTCHNKLKDTDGNQLDTGHITANFGVSPSSSSMFNCIAAQDGAMEAGDLDTGTCHTNRLVLCESRCVDGGWSDWINSSSCSVTCGSFPGVMEQTRTCDNPLQVGAGLPCDGDPVQNISCTNDDPCPGPTNGGFGAWQDNSGGCSVTCGGGTRTEERLCDTPAPANGGLNCTGDFVRQLECNNQSCPPVFTSWSSWGPCSVTCDYGVRQETRSCSVPGGCSGLGLSSRTEYCQQGSCGGITIGTPMRPYRVNQAALDDFLSGATTVALTGAITPIFECTHACLLARAPNRHNYAACNGFVLIEDDNSCRIGYKDPDWVVAQKEAPGHDGIIYFDIQVP